MLTRSLHAARKHIEDVYVVSCARTPLGSMGGTLKVEILQYCILHYLIGNISRM